MERREPIAIVFMLLLMVSMCAAFRIPDSFGNFGRVPSVVKGGDELNAVITLQYRAQHQHLVRPMIASGAPEQSPEHGACHGLSGSELAHCQRVRFERFLTDDYQDAEANANVVRAPLPA